MKSGWVESEARATVERYARQGVAPDLALRLYSTRLLGGDPRLVLHGGGNTSVKTRMPDLLGETVDVLCIKGSGADMAVIEPAGMPAVRLDRLRRLRAALGAERRGHGPRPAREPARPGGAQSFGRDAAARVPAAQVRRSHPRHRHPEPGRPAGRRSDLRRPVRRPRRHRALRHAGLRARQARRRRLRRRARRSRGSSCTSTACSASPTMRAKATSARSNWSRAPRSG